MSKLESFLIVLAVGLSVAIYFIVMHYKGLDEVMRQNAAAMNDSLRILNQENATLYAKYASVSELNGALNNELGLSNEKVAWYVRENAKLIDIISSGTGTVIVDIDTSGVEKKTLFFKDSTEFCAFEISVEVVDPPKYSLYQQFKPFPITTFITRNKEGLWGSYVKIESPFDKYIKITDVKTIMDRDEFDDRGSGTKSSLSITPLLSPIIDLGNMHLGLGAIAAINGKWSLGYSKGVGLNLHMFHIGYQINF